MCINICSHRDGSVFGVNTFDDHLYIERVIRVIRRFHAYQTH